MALVCILGFLFWDRFAVVTRSVTQQIRGNDFVTAAAAVGASRSRIIFGEVLLNLATNAVEACTESETAGDRVVIRTRLEKGEILLSVEDNGVGMSEEVLARLFTRFFSTKGGKGTGLGLPVVRKIAEEHGGSLEIESEEGKGSVFRIRLPGSESAQGSG